MSTAASASPTLARSSSTSRRQPTYPTTTPNDRPHRSQSTSVRPSSGTAHRPSNQPQGHSRTPSASQRAAELTNVARRDFENSNVARQSSSSRRSSSHDRHHSATQQFPVRTDSLRKPTRGGSAQNDGQPIAQPTAAMPIDAATRSMAAATGAQPRRRTTITASTGTWSLGKTIGAGSMGKVKLAKNTETGEQVAVKIVPRVSTDEHRTPQERERADHSKEIRTAREAAIVSLVNHPYICGMRDVVRTNYHWYMLFEYVNGGQMLDYIISHGRLKEKQARKFGRQIASALDYCHRNSIVHRDLKIENILISKTGDIKIIDFGLSNLFSPQSHLKTFCGSLYFAAPELLQAKQYTGPEVDVWSFGIVLYVLVCGKVPFDDQSMPQLHAKIKKGHVEYPPWLSQECKNLISRMLVTDPKQRASLQEIMNHPWMTKGFGGPPENFLPHREPLQLPLDTAVVEKMEGFDFGSADYIMKELTRILDSEEYQRAVRAAARRSISQTPGEERKRGVFDFYKRRNSTTSKDALSIPSSEAIALGTDPINAFSPLVSVYFLVREKQERERQEANPGALSIPAPTSSEKIFKMPDVQPPEAAYTNAATPEMAGEKPTGGRTRPRARTHGEDEIADGVQELQLNVPQGPVPPSIVTPPADPPPSAKKESTAAGLLRRLSTRRTRERPERPDRTHPPTVAISAPADTHSSGPVRRSFSVRRSRDRDQPSSASLQATSHQQQQDNLLSPPATGEGFGRKLRGLGRSTSVNSAELRRRMGRQQASTSGQSEVPPTSGSDGSSVAVQGAGPGDATGDEVNSKQRTSGAPASRTKSLGHARRESIQTRRLQRHGTRNQDTDLGHAHTTTETDAEQHAETGRRRDTDDIRGMDSMKPVYLKGLFSVSTTSNRPLPEIRAEIIRVLRQLGVEYWEIKGGFSCRHAPSINLKENEKRGPLSDIASPRSPESAGLGHGHRRKISFGVGHKDRDEFRDAVRSPTTPMTPHTPRSQRNRHGGSTSGPSNGAHDLSYTNTDESDASDRDPASKPVPPTPTERERGPRARPAGETMTHVQNDIGESMVLRFEIFIVKVPLLSLHGIQFKKMEGNVIVYKNMAQEILKGLRL
ncbi:Pkinase-domain-containing protein [Rhizodiscina lignyota]|uniref:non-specific serine/threonine protein kinase n=1 Tax=Rhizodiscina lignyota TaxID=1504668 RepID=A0A9P4I495_9PEZI|nr:Pkinase-domain-containing protein [Rhizodiscina lignyota]